MYFECFFLGLAFKALSESEAKYPKGGLFLVCLFPIDSLARLSHVCEPIFVQYYSSRMEDMGQRVERLVVRGCCK